MPSKKLFHPRRSCSLAEFVVIGDVVAKYIERNWLMMDFDNAGDVLISSNQFSRSDNSFFHNSPTARAGHM